MQRPIFLTLVAVSMALPCRSAAQQTVDPSVRVRSTVLLDNARVRMVEVEYQPGSVSEQHTHPFPRAVYVASGGIVELVAVDGTVTRLEVRRGDALWRPSETHTVRNIGPTVVTLVETEIKGAQAP